MKQPRVKQTESLVANYTTCIFLISMWDILSNVIGTCRYLVLSMVEMVDSREVGKKRRLTSSL